MSALAAASVVHASTVDEAINDAVSSVANFISGLIFYSIKIGDPDDLAYVEIPLIVVWLIVAAAFVKTTEPATEGFVSLLEPFIDTVVICTMTSLAIVITGTGSDPSIEAGVATTSAAFGTVAPWFPFLLAVAVILFAFSTMISWS